MKWSGFKEFFEEHPIKYSKQQIPVSFKLAVLNLAVLNNLTITDYTVLKLVTK